MSIKTPFKRVEGLGSAKDGTEHFWRQRLTAVANIPLMLAFVWIFGAVATVAVGYLRTKTVPARETAQTVPAVIENC